MPSDRMPLVETLRVLQQTRRDEVVVTAMSVAREWSQLSDHPLDFTYVPSSMGQTTSLAVGIALAQPSRTVIVCTGDGQMLMNLGSFITLSALAPPNLRVLVFDNGVYEVTGAQITPASAAGRVSGSAVSLSGVAQACGFEHVADFRDSDAWATMASSVLASRHLSCSVLHVEAVEGGVGPKQPKPGPEQAREFISALNPS